MLDPKEFKSRYKTKYKQLREESYLKEVSEDDKLAYTDGEILTGRNKNGFFNIFNNFGISNRGKPKSADKLLAAQYEKFKHEVITKEDLIAVYNKILEQAKAGEYKQQQLFIDRIQGKLTEKLDIKVDENISFSIKPDKNSMVRQKENLKKEKENK